MSQQVITKWHRFVELVRERRFGFYEGHPISDFAVDKYLNYDVLLDFVQKVSSAPKLVIAPELEETMTADLIASTVLAMSKAEVLRLPYPKVLIEATLPGYSDERWFIFCEEGDFDAPEAGGGSPDMQSANGGKIGYYPFRAHAFSLFKKGTNEWAVIHPFVLHLRYNLYSLTSEQMVSVACPPAEFIADRALNEVGDILYEASKSESNVVARVLSIGFVVTGTSGVKKEVIEYERLNRKRTKSGKEPVPQIQYMRIGHVYRANGEKVKYENVGGDSKLRRVYFRKGHTRNQRFGKGLTESKMIFIEAVLVNYNPEDGKPERPAPVTKVGW